MDHGLMKLPASRMSAGELTRSKHHMLAVATVVFPGSSLFVLLISTTLLHSERYRLESLLAPVMLSSRQ